MSMNGQEIMVAGIPLRYRQAGSGPPLVLLHGAGDNGFDWEWVMPTLAQSHQVYAPDMPGYGGPAVPSAPISVEFFPRCIGTLLDTLELTSVVLVGHSLGGLGALRYTLDNPGRVAGLVLVSSGGLGREIHSAMRLACIPGYGDVAALWGQAPAGALYRAWSRLPLLFAQPERVPAAWVVEQYQLAQQPGVLNATVDALRAVLDIGGQRVCFLDELHRLTLPTLVVWGERDQVIPVSHAHKAVERLPYGQLAVIPDCGHVPHVERPEQFAAIVSQFLGIVGQEKAVNAL